MKKAITIALLTTLATLASATERSSSQRAAFVRENHCPATGKPRGPCPGHVVDHVVPLCAGGDDAPSNMQWQTVEDAKQKDKDEWRTCRVLRASRASGSQ
ncbi:HNH endonuclease signature motif containing protein [Propionivibrio limicola]|uniref:HNH endonuclease signature motif containing protein n=1 Tax=Propionivibrio limicola TaxID=167645 RepID=UPI001291E537|nr:HNH endonuclease signature motif containing protein [Propionivibrio limicola]